MTKSKPSLPTFKPGSESSQIGEQKVEEILLLAKKRSLENPGLSMTPVQTAPTAVASTVFTNAGDKLVINNLLNTAASQLNLAPPNLSSLVPVRTGMFLEVLIIYADYRNIITCYFFSSSSASTYFQK